MDMRDLRYFQCVAELGHIGKAAERSHRTQPAITKSIQRLEAELGEPLFDRTSRKLSLTAVGRLLQSRAQVLLRDMDELQRELGLAARGESGHVRLGVATTAADLLLSPLLRGLMADAPDITLEIEVGMHDGLAAALAAHRLDLIVAPSTHVEDGLAFERVLTDEVVVVADKGHPLAARRTLDLAHLVPYRWVLPSRSAEARHWLESRFAARGLPKPKAQVESNSISLTPGMVAGTPLLSFVSRRNLAMAPLATWLRELRLPGHVMQRDFGILQRADTALPPAAQAVRRQLQACYAGFAQD